MGLRPLEIFSHLQCRDRIAFRRQNLTSKVDPRAVRVNPYLADYEYCRFYSIFLVNDIGNEMCV